MRIYTKVALLIGFSMTILFSAKSDADESKINFQSGSSLVFSLPLSKSEEKIFGSGWKEAVFSDLSGKQVALFHMGNFSSAGGLIFDKDYSPAISPSGKYAVFSVLRTGIVDPGPSGNAEVSSRQYCPVLDTTSGCIVSMQTGEICGGDWAGNTDEWTITGNKYDSTSAMLKYEFNHVNNLWRQYMQSVAITPSSTIKDFVEDNLGIANMMTCEPPSVENRGAYLLMAGQLRKEGDFADANFVEKRLGSDSGNKSTYVAISVDRSRLYENPDPASKTKMYLIKGDLVQVIGGRGADWVQIEYKQSNGKMLTKWIACFDIALCKK
ncbi:hypothetical protein HDG32_000463 [Paraburkholderia sp. CI2]|uniref:hypothetical protein n=1 Tax=Paraburkholderia sp. CI2 TaxID=2723093 RepID=UPI00160F9B9C|nr:hypothetical protein [Paraburkholderia sp. CI2]MBB5464370.1 hypothetical protein [Paraburkholderia sp. CI2]